MDKTEYM